MQGLAVLEIVRVAGSTTAATVGAQAGWDRVKAHRYLSVLAREGWLTVVEEGVRRRYVLGRKCLELAPDLGFNGARVHRFSGDSHTESITYRNIAGHA